MAREKTEPENLVTRTASDVPTLHGRESASVSHHRVTTRQSSSHRGTKRAAAFYPVRPLESRSDCTVARPRQRCPCISKRALFRLKHSDGVSSWATRTIAIEGEETMLTAIVVFGLRRVAMRAHEFVRGPRPHDLADLCSDERFVKTHLPAGKDMISERTWAHLTSRRNLPQESTRPSVPEPQSLVFCATSGHEQAALVRRPRESFDRRRMSFAQLQKRFLTHE